MFRRRRQRAHFVYRLVILTRQPSDELRILRELCVTGTADKDANVSVIDFFAEEER